MAFQGFIFTVGNHNGAFRSIYALLVPFGLTLLIDNIISGNVCLFCKVASLSHKFLDKNALFFQV